jgi:hypothetical protein
MTRSSGFLAVSLAMPSTGSNLEVQAGTLDPRPEVAQLESFPRFSHSHNAGKGRGNLNLGHEVAQLACRSAVLSP